MSDKPTVKHTPLSSLNASDKFWGSTDKSVTEIELLKKILVELQNLNKHLGGSETSAIEEQPQNKWRNHND